MELSLFGGGKGFVDRGARGTIERMHRNHKRQQLRRNLIISLIIFAIAATASGLVMKFYIAPDKTVKPATMTGLDQKTPGNPQFTFAPTADWRQGPVDKVSLAAFHNGNDSCFISVQQKTGSVDAVAAIQKSQDSLRTSGYTVTPAAIVPMKLQTNAGPLSYELYQYAITGGSSQLLGGQAQGYLAVPNGYIKVEAHCSTVDQLSATLPPLRAISFIPAKM